MEVALAVFGFIVFVILMGVIVHAHKRHKHNQQIIRENEMRIRDLQREKRLRGQLEKISKMEAEHRTQKENPKPPYRKSSSQPLKGDSSSARSRRDDSSTYDNTSTIMTYAALSSSSSSSCSSSSSSDSSSSSSSCDY